MLKEHHNPTLRLQNELPWPKGRSFLSFGNDYLDVSASITNLGTSMSLNVKGNKVYTGELPNTLAILKEQFPTVLKTECCNDVGQPFVKEVLDTELGHLFEHILLQKLAHKKYMAQHVDKDYSGETSWDWHNNPRGSYEIALSSTLDDLDVFPDALKESADLLSEIITSDSN
jgi:hypothetical protein